MHYQVNLVQCLLKVKDMAMLHDIHILKGCKLGEGG